MTQHGFDDAIVDLARGAAMEPADRERVRRHVAECSACAARLQREEALTGGLRALAEASSAAGPSAAMEDALLRAFAAAPPRAAGLETPGNRWQPWMAVAAAVILAAVVTAGWRGYERSRRPVPEAPTVEAASNFVPWPGASALPVFESGQLVRTELPASVLPLLGIARASDVEGKVEADVLVGQDGFVRAVRLAR
jgi:anti-sigma factor RsiW